jgi:hypothetical protein
LSGLPGFAQGVVDMNELMRTVRSASLVAAALVLAATGGRANTIMESFTIPIPSGSAVFLVGDSIPQFNPANGTLNDIELTGTGSATWTATIMPPNLEVILRASLPLQITNIFTVPGNISLNFPLTTASDPATLSLWTGLGTQTVLLNSTGNPADTITNGSVTGTLTFDFTPTAAVPEPSTWAMMLIGFAGLGFAFRQSRRRVSFA